MASELFSSLIHGYTHAEWAEITGLSQDFLQHIATECPAWRHKRWWPVPFQLYLVGLLPSKSKGRNRKIDIPDQRRYEVWQNLFQKMDGRTT